MSLLLNKIGYFLSRITILLDGNGESSKPSIDNTNTRKITKWSDFFPTGSKYEGLSQVFDTMEIVMYVIMGIIGAAGAIYAIYLGIQLARAEDQSKRDDAKKHLITVAIAIGVTIVLILFFTKLLPIIIGAFIGKGINSSTNKPITKTQIIPFLKSLF